MLPNVFVASSKFCSLLCEFRRMGPLYRVALKLVAYMVIPIRFLQRPLGGYSLPLRVARKINSYHGLRERFGIIIMMLSDSYLFARIQTQFGLAFGWHGQFVSLSGLQGADLSNLDPGTFLLTLTHLPTASPLQVRLLPHEVCRARFSISTSSRHSCIWPITSTCR